MTRAIDLDHLEKYVCGDAVLRGEVLGIFETQLASFQKTINPETDDAAWYDAMHAIKGAARGVGAWALGRLCERGEALIGDRVDKLADRRKLAVELSDAIAAALTEAAGLCETVKASTSSC